MEYIIQAVRDSLQSLFVEVMQFIPQLIVAIVVLIIGWIIAGILGKIVRKAFVTLHIDDALDRAGVDELSRKAGYAFKPGQFAGLLVKWFIILAFSIVAFDTLGLEEVTVFVRDVLNYLPQVFAASLILFAAVLIGNVASKSLEAALRASSVGKPALFASLARYAVVAFGVMAALNQLGIADELVETLFMGIVFALSLGAGLAFGLGGKEAAGKYINQTTNTDS